MGGMIMAIGIIAIVVVIFISIFVVVKHNKHMKTPMRNEIDVIIKRGDYYESAFYEFIQKKVLSDEAFDKRKAYDKNGKPTKYFTMNVNEIYDRAFPLYFVQPMKAKKYAFSEDFAAYILGEHADTPIKKFPEILIGFEHEGFTYTPEENIEENIDTVESNIEPVTGEDRRMSKADANLDRYSEDDIHGRVDIGDEVIEEVSSASYNVKVVKDWHYTENDVKDLKTYVNRFVMNYFKKHDMQVKTADGKSTAEYKRMYQSLYKGACDMLFDGEMFSQDYQWWITNISPECLSEAFIRVIPKYFEDKGINLMRFKG